MKLFLHTLLGVAVLGTGMLGIYLFPEWAIPIEAVAIIIAIPVGARIAVLHLEYLDRKKGR